KSWRGWFVRYFAITIAFCAQEVGLAPSPIIKNCSVNSCVWESWYNLFRARFFLDILLPPAVLLGRNAILDEVGIFNCTGMMRRGKGCVNRSDRRPLRPDHLLLLETLSPQGWHYKAC